MSSTRRNKTEITKIIVIANNRLLLFALQLINFFFAQTSNLPAMRAIDPHKKCCKGDNFVSVALNLKNKLSYNSNPPLPLRVDIPI